MLLNIIICLYIKKDGDIKKKKAIKKIGSEASKDVSEVGFTSWWARQGGADIEYTR